MPSKNTHLLKATEAGERKMVHWLSVWQEARKGRVGGSSESTFAKEMGLSPNIFTDLRDVGISEKRFTVLWECLQRQANESSMEPYILGAHAVSAGVDRGQEVRLTDLDIKVRTLRDENEVRDVFAIECRYYGGDILAVDDYIAWWDMYPQGTYALLVDNMIVGAVGMWPLKEEAYRKLTRGELEEKELDASNIVPLRTSSHSYWYWADIIQDKRLLRDIKLSDRDTKYFSHYMLSLGILEWMLSGHLPHDVPINVCALRYTGMGEVFLKDYGFKHCMKTDAQGQSEPVLTPNSDPDKRASVWYCRSNFDDIKDKMVNILAEAILR